jgi:hypothetical protein
MKKLFLLFSLLLFSNVFSQNIEKLIVIKDSETNLPIEDVTVVVLKTKQILMSNKDGKVNFILKGASNIKITHTAYLSMQIRSINLKNEDNVIFLKSNKKELEEVVITKEHPQKILVSLIKNSIKQLTIPARLKVYSREFFKQNGEYEYFNDGLMNFQLFGNSKKFTSNVLVEQNRAYGLIDEGFSTDLQSYNLNNLMENYYNFKYLKPLLTTTAKKQYDFIIKVYAADKSYYVINAIPLEDAKGLLDDFEIIYDPKRKLIIEASSILSEKMLWNNKNTGVFGAKKIFKSIYKTVYKVDNDDYYLIASKEEIGFEKTGKTGVNKFEVLNNLVTTNFSNANYTYKDNELFKDKTLFNKKNVILSQYWNASGLVATDAEQKIIEDLDNRDDAP